MKTSESTTYDLKGMSITMLDITGPEVVEIDIKADESVVWVNVNGICRFRACQIKKLEINAVQLREGANHEIPNQGS